VVIKEQMEKEGGPGAGPHIALMPEGLENAMGKQGERGENNTEGKTNSPPTSLIGVMSRGTRVEDCKKNHGNSGAVGGE